jgi:hypothetical protein
MNITVVRVREPKTLTAVAKDVWSPEYLAAMQKQMAALGAEWNEEAERVKRHQALLEKYEPVGDMSVPADNAGFWEGMDLWARDIERKAEYVAHRRALHNDDVERTGRAWWEGSEVEWQEFHDAFLAWLRYSK